MTRLGFALLAALWAAPSLVSVASAAVAADEKSHPVGRGAAPTAGAAERRLGIFYTAEIRGAIEPCGCTSDPLGDVARFGAVVRRAQKDGPVLVVDAGDMLYRSAKLPRKKQEGFDLAGRFLAEQMVKIGLAGAAVGELDVARGADHVHPKRLASNLDAPFVEPPKVREIGGIRVGLLGVADPAWAKAGGWKAEDPVAAAKRDAARLRADRAEVVIALAAVDRAAAQRIAKDAPVDFVVVGREVGKGREGAAAVGRAFLLTPGEELERAGRLDLVVRGSGGPFVDAGDGSSPPAQGSYFTNRLLPLRRSLPAEPVVTAAKKVLDRKVGVANLRAKERPVPAEPGRASFVGMDKCVKCHKTAFAFWKTTVHARAWKTLRDGGKQHDYACVECHTTGFDQVGGSTLGYTKSLENVQCEVCHGPGSIHVAEEGNEDPPAVKRQTPESRCVECHSEKHSDTFQYQAYLRDILGRGHGAAARKKLGDGPSGRELRKKAQADAKAKGIEQAKAM